MNPESPQASSSPEVRLLPLAEGAPSEMLANTLARLLTDDASQAESGARGALLILTGVQAFLDSGGNPHVIELAWEPTIAARELEKNHGADAWKRAAELAGEALAADDAKKAQLYGRVALMLKPTT